MYKWTAWKRKRHPCKRSSAPSSISQIIITFWNCYPTSLDENMKSITLLTVSQLLGLSVLYSTHMHSTTGKYLSCTQVPMKSWPDFTRTWTYCLSFLSWWRGCRFGGWVGVGVGGCTWTTTWPECFISFLLWWTGCRFGFCLFVFCCCEGSYINVMTKMFLWWKGWGVGVIIWRGWGGGGRSYITMSWLECFHGEGVVCVCGGGGGRGIIH